MAQLHTSCDESPKYRVHCLITCDCYRFDEGFILLKREESNYLIVILRSSIDFAIKRIISSL